MTSHVVALDAAGTEYPRWIFMMPRWLEARGILASIQDMALEKGAPDPRYGVENSQAVDIILCHLDETLRTEYASERCAREIWDALRHRFGNIRDHHVPN
ncbi:hypothetical protein ACLB2K_026584 [Fragaria x ananassa]